MNALEKVAYVYEKLVFLEHTITMNAVPMKCG